MTKRFPALQTLAAWAEGIDDATMAAEAIQEVLHIVGLTLHDASPSERQTKLKALVDVALTCIRHSDALDTKAVRALYDAFFLEV